MAHIDKLQQGVYRLSGVLDFATVTATLAQLRALFEPGVRLEIDLSGLERTNSAGLALLLELQALAKRHSVKLHFSGMPSQLADLARMSNVDDLLPTS